MGPLDWLPEPSEHALALAGWPLVGAESPRVEALAAAEVVVVVSRSRDPEAEVELDRCRRDRVPVVVRPSGGGAVVLAPGVVVASALHRASGGLADRYFRHFCAAVAAALAACGAAGAERRGVSDLCLGDRKVAGSSLRVWRKALLFQASVLVDVDVGLLERYLKLPARAPAYRAGRGHRDFVTTLREAGTVASRAEVAAALGAALAVPPPP